MFKWYIEGVQRSYEPKPVTVTRLQSAHSVERIDPDKDRARSPYPDLPSPKREPALTASQIMSSPVSTLTDSTPLATAVELFRTRRFRHVPILGKAGRLVGIISDRDVLKHLSTNIDPFSSQSTTKVHLSDVMRKKVLTALPSSPIREIARLMFEERIGCIPVLDESHLLVGIVTRSDILRAVMTHAPLELWV